MTDSDGHVLLTLKPENNFETGFENKRKILWKPNRKYQFHKIMMNRKVQILVLKIVHNSYYY